MGRRRQRPTGTRWGATGREGPAMGRGAAVQGRSRRTVVVDRPTVHQVRPLATRGGSVVEFRFPGHPVRPRSPESKPWTPGLDRTKAVPAIRANARRGTISPRPTRVPSSRSSIIGSTERSSIKIKRAGRGIRAERFFFFVSGGSLSESIREKISARSENHATEDFIKISREGSGPSELEIRARSEDSQKPILPTKRPPDVSVLKGQAKIVPESG